MLSLGFEEDTEAGSFSSVFSHVLYAFDTRSKTQNGAVLETELLQSWMAPRAFRRHCARLFVGAFCAVSGGAVPHLGISALLRKEQACTLRPFYCQLRLRLAVGSPPGRAGSLGVRCPLGSV